MSKCNVLSQKGCKIQTALLAMIGHVDATVALFKRHSNPLFKTPDMFSSSQIQRVDWGLAR